MAWFLEVGDGFFDSVSQDLGLDFFVSDSEYLDVNLREGLVSSRVLLRMIIVDPAIDLDDQPVLGTVKVDDKAADDLLPPKLQPKTPPATQDLPGRLFRRRCLLTKTLREGSLLRSYRRMADHTNSLH